MVYEAIYNIPAGTLFGTLVGALGAGFLCFCFAFMISGFDECAFWFALTFSIVVAVIFTGVDLYQGNKKEKEAMANPEFQKILLEARELDFEVDALKERARRALGKEKDDSPENKQEKPDPVDAGR